MTFLWFFPSKRSLIAYWGNFFFKNISFNTNSRKSKVRCRYICCQIWRLTSLEGTKHIRAFQLVVLNSGQKMALRAFYFIRTLTKALTYHYINHSERHLLAIMENSWFESPIVYIQISHSNIYLIGASCMYFFLFFSNQKWKSMKVLVVK